MKRLVDKVALVTGGASGIGHASAVRLAQEGAAIIIADIDAAAGHSVAAEIAAQGGAARFEVLDVTDETAWARVVASIAGREGALHILVSSAGISLVALLADLSAERWRRTMSINLDGVYLGCRAAVPLIAKSGGGSVVNVSSSAGAMGTVGLSHYCASKAAVRYFSKSIALECAVANNGVRVNCVLPGGVETPIWSKMGNNGLPLNADASEMKAAMDLGRRRTAEVTPLGRAGTADEIAAAIAYLASDEAAFMTGADLIIDGGATAGRNFMTADART